jgi:putative endonuclease
MNESSPDRAAVLALAEQEALASGLRVLGRQWRSGDHELALVAAAGERVLVVIEVTVAEHGAVVPDFADVSEKRIAELESAAGAWMAEHDSRYRQIRVDVAGLSPDGRGGFTAEYIEGAG